jgi:hypothetical protein
MDPQSLVITFRMIERILGVLIGGLLIYFGYRLFLSLLTRAKKPLSQIAPIGISETQLCSSSRTNWDTL